MDREVLLEIQARLALLVLLVPQEVLQDQLDQEAPLDHRGQLEPKETLAPQDRQDQQEVQALLVLLDLKTL